MFRPALRALTVLVVASAAVTFPLAAQTVRGRVEDSLSRAPVARGFVVLLDEAGREVARTLTTSTAQFSLRAPSPGRYRLRSELIGYRVAQSESFWLDAGTTVDYVFEIVPLPIALDAVKVQAASQCREDPALAAATAVVWDEIRKALEAAAWDGTRRSVRYRFYSFERELSADRRRVTREAGRVVEGLADRPFGSLPADQLARDGYVVTRSDEIRYALPDAEVLLHPAFLGTHCFHVVRDEQNRAGEVGLAFRPVKDRDVPDVRGTLWLDEATAELEILEIVFTELPQGVEDDRGGGTVEFLRLPSGAWIVERWELRTPLVRVVRRDRDPYGAAVRTDANVIGWRDFGGEVLEVTTGEQATLVPANLAQVEGTVYDSTRGGPLADAVVALEGTPFSASTDTRGGFHLAVPVQGEYALTVAHPWLDSIGYRRAQHLVPLLRGMVRPVTIVVPHARSWARQLCPAPSGAGETGAVLGEVLGPARTPIAAARVTATWQASDGRSGRLAWRQWEAQATTDRSGSYTLCGLPTDRGVSISAHHNGRRSRSADLVLPVPARGQLLFAWDRRPGEPYAVTVRQDHPLWKVDFTLDRESAGAPTADTVGWVSGLVVDGSTGAPVGGVAVAVNGRDSALSRDDGTFDVVTPGPLPSGNVVTFARVGYQPRVLAVDLPEGERRLALSAPLEPLALVLEAVTVTAEAMDRYVRKVGFYERKQYHQGYFLDREYIESHRGRVADVVELLGTLPAIANRRMSSLEAACDAPAVWVDGVRFPAFNFRSALRPDDLAAVEVYRTPSQVPPQYAGAESGCGVVLFWTRQGAGR